MVAKEIYFLIAFVTIWCVVFLKYFTVKDIKSVDFKSYHIKSNKIVSSENENLNKLIPVPRYEDLFNSIPKMDSGVDYGGHSLRISKQAAIAIHKIQFGIFIKHPIRAPTIMIRTNIEMELLQKFQELPMFSCPESELENYGMIQAVDYPRSKNHIYHEGYYHTFMDQKAVYSRNPRSGADFMKSAAGLFISSFYEATRQLNQNFFKKLSEKLWLDASNRVPNDPSSDICGTLSEWISGGFLFGDLSIQVHYGTAIGGDELFWHSDAENSLIHLGLSIRGNRVLHSKRAEKPDEMVKELMEQQTAGDVYLSTSTLVNHAPSYPEVNILIFLYFLETHSRFNSYCKVTIINPITVRWNGRTASLRCRLASCTPPASCDLSESATPRSPGAASLPFSPQSCPPWTCDCPLCSRCRRSWQRRPREL